MRLFFASIVLCLGSCLAAGSGHAAPDCSTAASTACYVSFDPPGARGHLHYYASLAADAAPTAALIALHGHPRDANTTFEAALLAAQRAGRLADTLVIAPVFQVAAGQAAKCRTADVPAAQAGDLLWSCDSWIEGGPAANGAHPTSFAALDALVAELHRRWPSLRSITVAGFSAGAQMVQHSIGFAAVQPEGSPSVRYVVSDPGTWLYFDPVRPRWTLDGQAVDGSSCIGGAEGLGGCTIDFSQPGTTAACPTLNRWKYGTEALPDSLGRRAAEARAHYAAADISVLEGALDSSAARGTFYPILDKSCAAMAQGPYRLQRGLAYAAYERAVLKPAQARSVVVVPGCAHDVACVFPSAAASAALLGAPNR